MARRSKSAEYGSPHGLGISEWPVSQRVAGRRLTLLNVTTGAFRITDEDITRVNGRREELASRLQARYGFRRTEALREIRAWMRSKTVMLSLKKPTDILSRDR